MQLASYSFDISIRQILTTLIAGGCICIPSEQDRETDISGAMQRMGMNWFNSVPSVVPLLDPEQLGNLKTFILRGEPLNMTIIRN
jgi:non-ribosomal peptide synthetase component F